MLPELPDEHLLLPLCFRDKEIKTLQSLGAFQYGLLVLQIGA